jgi:hypothetical protein
MKLFKSFTILLLVLFSFKGVGQSAYIIGQVGYCPATVTTLSVLAKGISAANLPNTIYAWTGSDGSTYNTPTIAVSPSAATSYTLLIHNGTFVSSPTVTIHQMTSENCNNCQLVQNGSFESVQNNQYTNSNIIYPTSCIQGYSIPVFSATNPSDPINWVAPTCGTPDYYNNTYRSTTNGVPANTNSVNTPTHNGNGYGGIITYYWKNNKTAFEYLQTSLKCPLVAGQAYNVSFYASLSPNAGENTPSNNLGAYLSTTAISNTATGGTVNLSYTPQVNSAAIISSTNPGTWTQISGSLVGNGEQYITIGNFYTTAQTAPYPTSGGSYFFIDDVSVLPALPTLTSSSYTVNCSIPSTLTLTANGAANAYTSWTNGINTYTGSTIYVPSPTSNTTYTCTVSLPCGTCSPITQTISILAVAPITIAASQTTCAGTGVALTASGANTYTWSPANSLNTPNGPNVSATPGVTTIYTVSANASCGGVATATTSVNVVLLPTVTSIFHPQTICYGNSAVLTASAASTITWSPASGLSSSTGSPVTATPLTTTIYTASVSNSSGCVGSLVTSITVKPKPEVRIAGSTDGFYITGFYSSITGTSYVWNVATDLTSSAPFNGQGTSSINNVPSAAKEASPGSVEFMPPSSFKIISLSLDGCSSSLYIPTCYLTTYGVVTPISISGSTQVAPGSTQTYILQYGTTTLLPGITWFVDGGTILSGQNTTSVTIKWGSGYYGKIAFSAMNGATNPQNAVLDIAICNSTFLTNCVTPTYMDLCASNNSVNLNALNSGSTYLWSTGATTQSIAVPFNPINPFDFYYVTVVNPGGCKYSFRQEIRNNGACRTMAAESININSSYNFYPNPANSYLTVQSTTGSTLGRIAIYNLFSELVYESYSKKSKEEIDIHNLPAGVYMLFNQGIKSKLIKE